MVHFYLITLKYLFLLVLDCVVKTDTLLGDCKYNLNPLKMAYIIKINIKSQHKLTDKNYKRLSILL